MIKAFIAGIKPFSDKYFEKRITGMTEITGNESKLSKSLGDKTIGIGVIGFGGFALFAMQHIMQIQGLKLVGIAGTNNEGAQAAAKRFDAKMFSSVGELVNQPDVDVVYIATPPFLHYEQSMMALKAGKNVICEKPLATRVSDAEKLIEEADKSGLLMTVNLMQRYNPVYMNVKKLIDTKILGEVLHAYFENYASDEFLQPDHWFWDKERSGGIFIEHGVHFFDMFEGWFGKGKVTSAQALNRDSTSLKEQVQCQAVYGNVLANFYHGFTQPARMDRQELRILFEKGDITLHEWVPYKININALVDELDTNLLLNIFPHAELKVNSYYHDHHRKVSYRHKDADVYQHINLRYGFDEIKMNVYGYIVKALFADQIAYLRNRKHERIITECNGLNSLIYAAEAVKLSEN